MRYFLTSIFLFIMYPAFAQEQYRILKDTTDSNSIVLRTQQISEIEVSARKVFSNIKTGSTGIYIDVKELKKLPNIMGDADPFKALQYMGGISQAGEASANMNVRGGENDQNQILLNGAPVENPTHLLGLFSVFNPDLIDQMTYIKSGIPAEYGGRLSSVIDIKNFAATPTITELAGNLGMIASRLSFKLPITDKFSIYAAHRRSYLGTIVIPLLLKSGIDPKLAQNNFEFWDSNMGFQLRISSATRLSGHFYSGMDIVKVSEKERFSLDDNTSRWGNTVGGLQLNHTFSENFSMVHYLNLSDFKLQSNLNWLNTDYFIHSDKSVLQYKSDFTYLTGQHKIKTGVELSAGKMLPVAVQKQISDTTSSVVAYSQSTDAALYFRDEWEYGPLLINLGLRAAMHISHPDSREQSVFNFSNRNSGKLFYGLEPRIFGRWLLDESSSFKLSAGKYYQYNNRVQLINLGLPLEIFVSASDKIKPSSLWHFSGGYFKTLSESSWEFSAETYYKNFLNLLEFGGNLNDLFVANNIENLLYTGRGYAYGAEFMLRKNAGRFHGWLNYTLGWNFRQFDDINNGQPFQATNDRRHDLSLIGFYNINEKLSISAAFVYATGSRLNLPRSWFIIDSNVVLEFSKYNSFKMPDYHRLDISLNYKLPAWKKLQSELNFSVYNVYNRANPFQVYYSTQSENGKYDFKIKMSYLTPVLPSLSWTFRL
ncbi:MAG: hypothetical protein EOM47_01985 [Bacteroidia bacterium]|nr:hypothetical protein [Bacteroidia bacterium]